MIRTTDDDPLRRYMMQRRHAPRAADVFDLVTSRPVPPALVDALTRPLIAFPAHDPCPAYVNVPGPRDTMHTVYCTETYGHADDGTPPHVGTIAATDRFGRELLARIEWIGL